MIEKDLQKQKIGSILYRYRKGITKFNVDEATKEIIKALED